MHISKHTLIQNSLRTELIAIEEFYKNSCIKTSRLLRKKNGILKKMTTSFDPSLNNCLISIITFLCNIKFYFYVARNP